jgi:ubiquinone/menaquinone biosynthesis C-methylase UbiE
MSEMPRVENDNHKLVREQYKTQDNLQVRIETHQKYTQPKSDFISFVLDKVAWTGQETVIDVGCGAGVYIAGAMARAGNYIACDLSLGMLQGLVPAGLPRVNLDVQQLPFASESADVILANHMLYHVPDQDTAVREIKRLLKPGGKLIAATNSAANMSELTDLRVAIGRQFGLEADSELLRPGLSFTLEDGGQLLERHFSSVARFDHPSALVFPNSQPVVDYINSSRSYYLNLIPDDILWADIEAIIHDQVNGRIAQHGQFRVTKLTGAFVCQKEPI